MKHRRTIAFMLIALGILTTTYIIVNIAKGYRIDFTTRSVKPTGLLVATSVPDGAQIIVDGKLESATNNTLSLNPGNYIVEIKKDGFYPWKKTIKIEKELVDKTEAYLFPLLPGLKALTFTGAINPIISPDRTKIVYQVLGGTDKDGLWILDLVELPFGIAREPRQILTDSLKGIDFTKAVYTWTPDSKQVEIAITLNIGKTTANYLIDSGNLTLESTLTDITTSLPTLKKQWSTEQQLRDEQKMKNTPPEMIDILKNSAKNISFSPDDTKILYTATASATITDNLIPAIQGASTQTQERQIKPNRIYVYDIKEDRNFFIIENQPSVIQGKKSTINNQQSDLSWYPTSRHLLLVEKNNLTIMEYDNTNRTLVYSGNFSGGAYPFSSGNKIAILTTISSFPNSKPNLYAVTFK